jgi:hypothetical protein
LSIMRSSSCGGIHFIKSARQKENTPSLIELWGAGARFSAAFLVIPIWIISKYKSLRDCRLQQAAVCASPVWPTPRPEPTSATCDGGPYAIMSTVSRKFQQAGEKMAELVV